jgi:hypothetical protein
MNMSEQEKVTFPPEADPTRLLQQPNSLKAFASGIVGQKRAHTTRPQLLKIVSSQDSVSCPRQVVLVRINVDFICQFVQGVCCTVSYRIAGGEK